MYLTRPAQPFAAGHESAGVTAPATSWFLAEGATGPFFDLFILIANPNDTRRAGDGRLPAVGRRDVSTKSYTRAGRTSRFNIWVDDEEIPGRLGQRPLAERRRLDHHHVDQHRADHRRAGDVVAGPDVRRLWNEAHNSPGATTTGTRWALAEGEVGGPHGAETYILIANTSATCGQARR